MKKVLKDISIIIIITLLLLTFIEITVRFVTSIRHNDFKYLTYGFKFSNTIYSTLGISNYRPYTGGYFAFPKNKIFHRLDWASKPLKINNLGLRGPDININKEFNIYRIVTMGASSTFGYTVNDDETYSAILQDILDDKFLNNNFEVINAGLPWFSTNDILVLFENLIIKLKPDIVTFYIGFNDASYLLQNELILKRFGKILGKLHLGFKKFSEYSYLSHYFFYRIDRKLGNYYNVYEKPIKLEEFNRIYEKIIISFSNNLIKINTICNKNKINCYFISQISSPIPTYKKLNNKIELKKLKKFNYNTYNIYLQNKLNNGEGLSDLVELNNFMQYKLTDFIRSNSEYQILDFTKNYIDDFDILNTYVHLNIRGNKSLAEFLSQELFNE